MSKRIFKKGRLIDLVTHIPQSSDAFINLPESEIPHIFSRLLKSKRIVACGVVLEENHKLWSQTIKQLNALNILAIPVIQVRLEILNCKRFLFSCFFPPEDPEQVTSEFIRRFETMTEMNFSSRMQALIDLVDLASGFILPMKVDLTPASLQCVPILYNDWGFYSFDIVYQETVGEFENILPGCRYQLLACSDAVILSQIASRTISISEGNISFNTLRSFVRGRNHKIKYSINLHPAGVFREKYHANLQESS